MFYITPPLRVQDAMENDNLLRSMDMRSSNATAGNPMYCSGILFVPQFAP